MNDTILVIAQSEAIAEHKLRCPSGTKWRYISGTRELKGMPKRTKYVHIAAESRSKGDQGLFNRMENCLSLCRIRGLELITINKARELLGVRY